jgi:hypothetical protein
LSEAATRLGWSAYRPASTTATRAKSSTTARVGLGRIVALHHRSPTSHQICEHNYSAPLCQSENATETLGALSFSGAPSVYALDKSSLVPIDLQLVDRRAPL